VAPFLFARSAIGRPGDHVRRRWSDLLIATRAAVGLDRRRTGDLSHDPLAVGMLFHTLLRTAPQFRGGVVTTTVAARHRSRLICAEAAPGLAAAIARGDKVLEERSRSKTPLTELEVQSALDRVRDVQADDV
jgi:hypothetical protein